MQIVRKHAAWLWVTLLAFVTLSPGGLGHAAGDSALVDAAKQGNFTAVRAQIAKRANVNEPARDGSTALLWAAYHSDVEMMRALLAAGAKVERRQQVRRHAAAPGQPHGRHAGDRRRWCAPAPRPRWRIADRARRR